MAAENPNRRKFFVAAAAGSVVAVGAAVVGTQAAPAKSKAAQGKSQGYQVTEHVRNYYRTARV